MASEIRVNKIENRSGLGTVTFADTGVDLAGIVTATTFSGSGASLTNVPDSALSAVTASKLTGALPAISGASLTGMASTENVRTGILDVAGISTFRNTMNVGAAVTISESGIEASGIGITCANINGAQIGGRRNIIINGAMQVAQRGTSSTTSGYGSVDRFALVYSNTDEAPTQAQVDVASGTTPYTLGFRKAFKITNGNQTGGAGTNDFIWFRYLFEAQDIANSGWNYTSTSSYVTLSFWVKSSVAQTFKGYLRSRDGTEQTYAFETGSLTADTWTKITKTISGNSNLTFDNDINQGIQLNILGFMGTDYTDSSVTEDAWVAYASGTRMKDNTSTWYTTNDATLEITGVQLEVGSQATSFEHRSFGEELTLCHRYFYNVLATPESGDNNIIGTGIYYASDNLFVHIKFPVVMRTTPTFVETAGSISNHYRAYRGGGTDNFDSFDDGIWEAHNGGAMLEATSGISGTGGYASFIKTANSNAKLTAFSAEL
jgi:hypothetical protein